MKWTLPLVDTIPWFRTVLAIRSVGIVVAIYLLDTLLDLGTSPAFIACGGVLGVIVASVGARTRLTWVSGVASLAAIWILFSVILYGADLLVGGILSSPFTVDTARLHINTFLLAFSLVAISTWFFWRVRSAVTVEAFVICAAAIAVFAAHRNFRFDRPKIINSLAWRLGLDPLSALMVVGSGVLIVGLTYLALASRTLRPQADGRKIQKKPLRRQVALLTFEVAVIFGLGYLVQRLVYNHFNAVMLARVANGVGMGTEAGISPLSFQSALGSTNQPAGLVRLEGDYSTNPFSPMIYLRESALSSFAGRELVFAGRAYDTDLPVVTPKDSFTGKEDPELQRRTPVVQSIYLLAAHDNAFALDYPVSIVQLKNPRPNRFKSTYRAYSVGPSFSQEEINTLEVGDPRWSPDVRRHYLVEHPDIRYKELAQEITRDVELPVMKVRAITDYLSRTSIYTLTPNHNTQPTEDPVAPFLFGDKRGYCVHFAHAVVYMARALGIPARIGTGYLTDLSQAKDGHILLRMSDRHAWGEVFLTGVGWVPFDVQPDQVESHADTQVDSKLLEELMGILEPGEEILPPSSVKDEPGMEDEEAFWTPESAHILPTIAVMALLFVGCKVYLRIRWRFTSHPRRRLTWGYIALASTLYDLGISRSTGETRKEFAHRSYNQLLNELSSLVVRSAYQPAPILTVAEIDAAIAKARKELATLPPHRKLLAIVNPSATIKFIARGTW